MKPCFYALSWLRSAMTVALALVLALPRMALAQQDFDPLERYEAGLEAFERADHRQAIQLWVDVLASSRTDELAPEMLRMVAENVVSAFEEAMRQASDQSELRGKAREFCLLYAERHRMRAPSPAVSRACRSWRPVPQEQAPKPSPVPEPPVSSLKPVGPVRAPVYLIERDSWTRAGIGVVVAGAATGAFAVASVFLEGNAMRRYHDTLNSGQTDTYRLSAANTWRTVAIGVGTFSVALVTTGAILCLLGTRPRELRALASGRRRSRLALGPNAMRLRF